MSTATWISLAVACATLLSIGAWLADLSRRRALRRAGRAYNERGQRGELEAEKVLRALGYRVAARRVTGSYTLEVDGKPECVPLIADLLVERDGQRLVAEVKTGRQAPRLGHADTRRQMLEYQLAFEVPGVLLVDAESGRVREVRFPVSAGAVLRTSSARRGLGWFAAITLMLVAALVSLLGRP